MAGIETKIREAKQAGYSDAEIVEFLAQTPDVGPQIATALENQYKPEGIETLKQLMQKYVPYCRVRYAF